MKRPGKIFRALLALVTLVGLAIVGTVVVRTTLTIQGLLTENKELQQAITSLTEEEQIGYAIVTDQYWQEGTKLTELRFVLTQRGDPNTRVLEREYTIQGDVVHFDALIVKFTTPLVLDGRERSLYLWRRVYGEYQSPSAGYPIETPGDEPARYRQVLDSLRTEEEELFWEEVWSLANNPDRLRAFGIQAVYGNAVYNRLEPGLIYVFKINQQGQVYPEVVPQLQ